MKGKLDLYIQNAENTICNVYYRGFEDGMNESIDILYNFYEVGNAEQNKFIDMIVGKLKEKRDE